MKQESCEDMGFTVQLCLCEDEDVDVERGFFRTVQDVVLFTSVTSLNTQQTLSI